MMVYPYRGEDMECAAAARAQMIANSLNNGNPYDDPMGIYSTSEDDGEYSYSEGGASNSVSTSRFVGTFYNPNNPSDTNSMVSSLQDELSNMPHLDYNNNSARSSKSASVPLDHPWKEVAVSPEQALGLPSTSRRRIWFWGFLLALSLLIGIAVSMGIVIGVNHEKNRSEVIAGVQAVVTADESFEEDDGETVPTDNSTYFSNDGYGEDSVPSPAPTSYYTPRPNSATQLINTFVRALPSYTQQELDFPTSPQQRALNWLIKDPNLTSYSVAQLIQRFVLKTFYFSTNGGNDELETDQQWLISDGWGSSSLSSGNEHECQWFTTYEDNTIEPACDDQGTFIVLSVRSNNLRGSLPRELSLLNSLRILDVELNSIHGEIPTELGLLTNLERLHLGSNDFSGTVPTTLGQLSQLMALELENNVLTGTIPTQLGHLKKLVNLTMDDNQFLGSMPPELTQLKLLENLLLHRNELTGSLPTEIGQWKHLRSLSFRNNLMSGSFPTEIGVLTSLERLWGYQNNLGGSIPSEMGLATALTQLSLSRNQLTGQLPTEIGQLTRLRNLWLYMNQFTGAIPSELGLLAELELLPVRDNNITGPVPAEVCALEGLEVTVDCLKVSCDCDCPCANEEESNDDI